MHIPVLLKETIEILNPQPGEFFIDGTVGSGGHAASILEKMMPRGKFLAIDWDRNILEKTKKEIEAKFQIPNSQFQIFWVNGNYADLPEILKKKNLGKADGLLLDLGMSSEQLEKSGRGFTFQKDEPLDMRYCTSRINVDSYPEAEQARYGAGADKRGYISVNQRTHPRESAAVVVNNYSEKDLADIFWKYGEERFSRKIAKKIVEERRKKPIKTTFDLVEIITKAIPSRYRYRHNRKIHPATRVFQALRIYVNDELGNLEKLLKNIDKIIKNKGRVAIISYHSLEDRLVKNSFREMAKLGKALILTKKPIRPSEEEIRKNPRSRSAKLRAIKLRFNSELRMQN